MIPDNHVEWEVWARDKYDILCHVDTIFYSFWVSKKEILESENLSYDGYEFRLIRISKVSKAFLLTEYITESLDKNLNDEDAMKLASQYADYYDIDSDDFYKEYWLEKNES